ncbi:hypothetical protein [uncultured Legionella sp.]|uniref:hypothetical protein n=1 Tax=uncultured Legionella sp. TaxID=210934 RepID=UPI0026063EA3|nr:hypothetical protein [uncultured Legionella sp.]
MSLKLVRSRFGRKIIYVPQLPSIPEEPNDVSTEESLFSSYSDSGDALSECGWLDLDDSDEPICTVKRASDYDVYSALLNTITILRQSGCEEFKRYQTVFDQYLKNYSTYLNTTDSVLEQIKVIHADLNNESGCCFSFFKKKQPVSTITNKLVTGLIHSNMYIELASIYEIQELAGEPKSLSRKSS